MFFKMLKFLLLVVVLWVVADVGVISGKPVSDEDTVEILKEILKEYSDQLRNKREEMRRQMNLPDIEILPTLQPSQQQSNILEQNNHPSTTSQMIEHTTTNNENQIMTIKQVERNAKRNKTRI